jgi:dTDP-4-amino-4,6-dideoxygalactose transaminase
MSSLAIRGGAPVRSDPYPAWPVWDERDVAAVTEVVKSGHWGGFPEPGPLASQFSVRFAALQDATYGIAMANGTVTMEVACRAAGLGWEDEVIVPAYSFVATAAAPAMAGAIPVLADILPHTLCISPQAVEAAITPCTKAIIPVHLAQNLADMDAIMGIANRYNLVVIEDCAHAHGAKWRQRGVGSIGHFGSFSFQSTKILTAGEGGLLTTNSAQLAERAHSIIDCGRAKDVDGLRWTLGSNYRMTELQASLLLVGLLRFAQQARQREEMATYADRVLGQIPAVKVLPHDSRHTTRSFYRYVFMIDTENFDGATHEVAGSALRAEGIPCTKGPPPMHRYELFQPSLCRLPVFSAFPERFAFETMSFPVAERAGEREAIWLDESVFRAGVRGIDDVVRAVEKVQQHAAELVR